MSISLLNKFAAISIDRDSPEPVFLQLKNGISGVIRREKLSSGSRLPSLRDIAKSVSISYLTVSKAINELIREGEISSVKTRGLYIAEKTIFPKKPVAVFLGDFRSYISAEMLEGINSVFSVDGIEIIPHSGLEASERIEKLRDMLTADRISGVIDFGDVIAASPKFLSEVLEKVPVVLINSCGNFDVDALIYSEDGIGMRELVDLLIERGHKKVVYLSADPKRSTGSLRKNAFEERAREKGLEYSVVENVTRKEDGYLHATRLLTEGNDFSAIVCWNDLVAAEVLRVLRKRGVKVPEEVAVTGFGNLDFCEDFYPAITTVEQNFLRMGENAAHALIEAWKKRSNDNPRRITTETELIVRQSL